ncbi:MAG: hypothetical protein ACWGPN_13415 [Gammaproteobacteria bacterium]
MFPNVPEAELDETIGPLGWRMVQRSVSDIEIVVDPSLIEGARASLQEIGLIVDRSFDDAFKTTLSAEEPPKPGSWRKKRELFRSDLA